MRACLQVTHVAPPFVDCEQISFLLFFSNECTIAANISVYLCRACIFGEYFLFDIEFLYPNRRPTKLGLCLLEWDKTLFVFHDLGTGA